MGTIVVPGSEARDERSLDACSGERVVVNEGGSVGLGSTELAMLLMGAEIVTVSVMVTVTLSLLDASPEPEPSDVSSPSSQPSV